jgi:tRNA-2-methylthio-N6-dimethylallyladenosine synthase
VGELNRLKKANPELVLGVTGCMAQRLGQEMLERAPYVDLVMGPDGYRKLPETLASAAAGGAGGGGSGEGEVTGRSRACLAPSTGRARCCRASRWRPRSPSEPKRLAVLELEPHENYEGLEVRRTAEVSAWVPVQRGCNYRCTYCIVPYVRGRRRTGRRSRCWTKSVDRGQRGPGGDAARADGELVRSTGTGTSPGCCGPWPGWMGSGGSGSRRRIPNDVTSELIAVMAEEPAVCRQLHLPVQSGADRVLKRMVRRYTVERFLEIVDELRTAMPDLALSTDVIVAFPGETEEEYEATLDLMRRVRFDDAFLYRYSPRDGTPATRLPEGDFLPEAWARRVSRSSSGCSGRSRRRSTAGRSAGSRRSWWSAPPGARATCWAAPSGNKVVAFPGDPSLVGRFVRVRLDDTTGATFMGRRVRRGEPGWPDAPVAAQRRAAVGRGA